MSFLKKERVRKWAWVGFSLRLLDLVHLRSFDSTLVIGCWELSVFGWLRVAGEEKPSSSEG